MLSRIKNERGFALTETVLLCIIAVAMASVAFATQAATRAQNSTAARIGAVFLAQEQMAALSEKASAEGLPEGSSPWLGEDGDLTLNNCVYSVSTMVSPAGTNVWHAQVTVGWHINGKKYEETFEREFVR